MGPGASKLANLAILIIQPSLRRKPTAVILHVGTNDVMSFEPREISEGIVNLGRKIKNHSPDCKITISSVILRSDENLDYKSMR